MVGLSGVARLAKFTGGGMDPNSIVPGIDYGVVRSWSQVVAGRFDGVLAAIIGLALGGLAVGAVLDVIRGA